MKGRFELVGARSIGELIKQLNKKCDDFPDEYTHFSVVYISEDRGGFIAVLDYAVQPVLPMMTDYDVSFEATELANSA